METNIAHIKYLSFLIGNEIFAIEIKYAREVIDAENITIVPNASNNLKGVINFRGTIVPVYDLRKKLNVRNDSIDKFDVFIMIHIPIHETKQTVAIIANKVYEVFEIPETQIEQVSEVSKSYSVKILSGTTYYNGKHIMLLEPDEIINKSEIKIKQGI